MFRRLGSALTCVAMFFIVGAHWAVLQMVAWGGMLESYSRTDGLIVAAQKTFSGDYPCDMCRRISEQKKKEEQAPVAKVEKKSETFVASRNATVLFPPPPDFLLSVPEMLAPENLSFPPPGPIPIVA